MSKNGKLSIVTGIVSRERPGGTGNNENIGREREIPWIISKTVNGG